MNKIVNQRPDSRSLNQWGPCPWSSETKILPLTERRTLPPRSPRLISLVAADPMMLPGAQQPLQTAHRCLSSQNKHLTRKDVVFNRVPTTEHRARVAIPFSSVTGSWLSFLEGKERAHFWDLRLLHVVQKLLALSIWLWRSSIVSVMILRETGLHEAT